jgi:hypothetical protein
MRPISPEEECRIAYAKLDAAESLRLFMSFGWSAAATCLWQSWIVTVAVAIATAYLTCSSYLIGFSKFLANAGRHAVGKRNETF